MSEEDIVQEFREYVVEWLESPKKLDESSPAEELFDEMAHIVSYGLHLGLQPLEVANMIKAVKNEKGYGK